MIYVGPFVPNASLNMICILPGSFQMGSAAIGGTAAPVHQVSIASHFCIGKYEVTQGEYQNVMGFNPSYFSVGWPNAQSRPVEMITWDAAMGFCAALTSREALQGRLPRGYQYRLPTEAEWEYCCRAGTTTEWNTGVTIGIAQANYSANSTTVVGSYPPNPWGLHDTHGNVVEWCLDAWNGLPNYPQQSVADPHVTNGGGRVWRGGSYASSGEYCRSANRDNEVPGYWFPFRHGFRVVLGRILVP
jgi:formylglycine-generating enzyme required for sulfatase activity